MSRKLMVVAVESERERRLFELCVRIWRRHLVEQAKVNSQEEAS